MLAFAVVFLVGCKPEGGADGGVDAGTDAGTAPTFKVHYHRALSDYAGWAVTATAGATESSISSTSTDGFGAVYAVTLAEGASALTFALSNGANTDAAGALTVALSSDLLEVWVISGYAKAITHQPLAMPGPDQVALYYQRPDGAYTGFGLHLWGSLVTETQWTSPLQSVGTDPDLGAAFIVPLATGSAGGCPAGTICLIMHKGDTKDPGPDMQWNRATLGDLVFLSSGSATLTTRPRPEGTIDLSGASAHLLARDTVAWNVTNSQATAFELRWALAGDIKVGQTVTGGEVIRLTPRATGIGTALAAKAPHLSSWRAFDVVAADLAAVPQALKGQLIAVARKADGSLLSATRVQTPFAIDDLFATTEPLGPTFATVAGAPTAHVWAPTAQSVKLHVYDAAKAELTGSPFTMTSSARGVWSATGPAGWYGQYYRFELTVFHPTTDKVETVTVTDPYSTSLSTDSKYSQFIDLADPALAPAGWATFTKPALAGPQDAVLYEGHVRDFSISDTTVPAGHRGRYLAFTDQTSDGMKHLTALAQAGLTHLHLLPVFDLATVPEAPADRIDLGDPLSALCAKATLPGTVCTTYAGKTIGETMAALPGDGETQQAIATAMRSRDGFNWGYDPLHYGAPRGQLRLDGRGHREASWSSGRMVMAPG
jgi:pullulanase